MSKQQVEAQSLQQYDIIEDEFQGYVAIHEVWADQGPGLGVMVKGVVVADGKSWEQRFIDPTKTVTKVARI